MSENNDIFELINSYIQQIGVVDCQIDSYNDFILNRLNRTIEEENILKYEYEPNKFYQVKLKNAFVDKPTHITEDRVIRYITPNEARMRDLNYESNICVDLYIKKYEVIDNKRNITSRNIIHRHPIAKIPVMINSVVCNLYKQNPEKRIEAGECKGDPGGYFIINGKERVIVAQERRNYNDVIILNKGEDYFADIRSMSTESGHSVLLQAYYSQDQLYFAIPNIDKKIPIGVVFKGFGLSNEEIETLFTGYDKYLKDIIKSSYFIENQEEALNYIGQFSVHNINEQDYVKYSDQILNYEILPHMSSYNKYNKIIFLKNMLTKLLDTVDGNRKLDERDNLSKKRIESTGILMAELFRTVYKNYIRKIQHDLKLDVLNTLSKYFNTVTKDIRLSFATGNWGSTRNTYVRNGVSQVLCRLSYTGMVSHLRRTNIPIGKEGKNSSIRQLHQSHAFFFCTAESPEGQAVGIVKNLAMTVSVTNKLDALQVKNVVTRIPGYQYINSINILKQQLLFINGQLYGYVEGDITTFVNKLFKLRESNVIHSHTSIVYNKSQNTIHIHTDEGRLIRPIINIENIDKLVYDDFEACLLNNSIVYRDAAELEMEVVAMTPKKITLQTRYLELHPCLMLGLIGNMIPFPDHNQAPRNVYYASMAKQVISLFANNYPQRVDTVAHVLHYPQKPIVDTKLSKMSGIHNQPFGINAIVAIACYSSFNQEDSVILNKAAVDKGLFVSTTYKTITVEEKKKIGNTVESICLPDKEYQNNSFNYRNIDKNGLPKKGALLQVGDVIVGKVVTKISKDSKVTYDNSVTVSASEEGIVDKIFITKSADNYKLVKIRIRSLRVPELGDKFASPVQPKKELLV